MANLYITVIANNQDGQQVHVKRDKNSKLLMFNDMSSAFSAGNEFRDQVIESLGYACEVTLKIERMCHEYVVMS